MNVFIILLGIFFASLGLMFIFLYTNLFTIGYSFLEFVKFISTRLECWLFIFGLIILIIERERWKKNVLLLRSTPKFWRRRKIV